jgi:hypothetical protein
MRRSIVLAVGIDHGDGARQARFSRVVVYHHDFQTGIGGGGEGVEGSYAAIHRHDQADAFGFEAQQRWGVGAVAFHDAIRNINCQIRPGRAEEPAQQCGGSSAVHVIVAKYRHPLAFHDGAGNAGCRGIHVFQVTGVRQQRL